MSAEYFTSIEEMSHDERVRSHALGHATNFAYGYNVARQGSAPLRASDVLNVAEVFRIYIESGKTADQVHMPVSELEDIIMVMEEADISGTSLRKAKDRLTLATL